MNIAKEKLRLYFIFSLFFFLSTDLQSQPASLDSAPQAHSHQNIINSAKEFLHSSIEADKYSKINIQMGRFDSRLTLPQCDVPLRNALAPGAQLSGKTTVYIRCDGNRPWTSNLSAHIKLYTMVIKTTDPLDKGHILKKADLSITEEEISKIRSGYFIDKKSLIGKQLKRRLPQNKLIKSNYVKSPTLVKRGELVSIVAEKTGYSVKMTGTAMMNGARGDRIRVKNQSSKRIVEGTVQQVGIVSIN